MTIIMYEEKQTKNTVRFTENSETPKLGTLYIPKATLQELGYKSGMALHVTMAAEGNTATP